MPRANLPSKSVPRVEYDCYPEFRESITRGQPRCAAAWLIMRFSLPSPPSQRLSTIRERHGDRISCGASYGTVRTRQHLVAGRSTATLGNLGGLDWAASIAAL